MHERPHRSVRMLPSDTVIMEKEGVLYARSPHPLGPYPVALTDRLAHWAERTPARTFLARRDANGQWKELSYTDAYARVRAIAQGLLARHLSPDRPVVILSGNSIEHALLALAAMHIGQPYAPVAPAYCLLARDYRTLRAIWESLKPALVFAAEGTLYERALRAVAEGGAEVVTCGPCEGISSTPFAELEERDAGSEVDGAHAGVEPSTIAKILFTSGSTGRPKGVINTQRMLCSNQQMIVTVMPFLAETPPVLCDWLPWNHTFGGNHNFGITLYNGGSLYIDDGKPTPAGFETTVANLREIATTAYFNVPRGYDLLVPRLRSDGRLRETFFSRMQMVFCAAASLRQEVASDLESLARNACGTRIPFVTGLGSTESAPFALCAGDADFTGGRIGVPAPGVELKVAPVDGKLEGRLCGPNITPGYWGDPELTAAAFDEEGYYRLGDALGLVDPADPSKGFTFEGRIAEDFKLSTGTWVRVGPVRAALLSHFSGLVQDVVISGHERDEVTALFFPNLEACRAVIGDQSQSLSARELLEHPAVRRRFAERLAAFSADHAASSTRIARAALLEEPPSLDAQEITDKSSLNQRAVLAHRARIVAQLYGGAGSAIVVDAATATLQDRGEIA